MTMTCHSDYDKIFLKKLQDCIIDLDELDQIIETNGERQSKIDLELSDWLHLLQGNIDDLKKNCFVLANIAEKIAILRLERASLRNEFELIKRYKEVSRQMMTKDNRQFVIAEIQKVMKNLNQPYQNRVITEKDIEMIKAVTVEESKSIKKKRARKSRAESEALNTKIWDLYNQGISQTKIAKMVGLTQPCINVRIKKMKGRMND